MSRTLNGKTMEELVADHLRTKGHLTPVEAQAMFRCRSLSRRITSLRDAGMNIISVYCKDTMGQRYVRYELVKG